MNFKLGVLQGEQVAGNRQEARKTCVQEKKKRQREVWTHRKFCE